MGDVKLNRDKEAELRRMQYLALGCLALAMVVFIATLFMPSTFATRLIKAGAEAAMVGGLADWFAVVALFRHPLGLRIPHTAIIPQSKNRIATNLADFVREKFLNPQVLTELIQRSDPAQRFASWLSTPSNARRVGRHAANLMGNWLDLVDDKRIQAFISDATKAVVGKLDFSQALGSVLEMLTKGGRHQQLLDAALGFVAEKLRDPALREKIAQRVVNWLKSEHKWKQMLLPTEWIGDQAAEAASSGLNRFLDEVANSPTHELRETFDLALKKLVRNLKTNEEFRRKGEEIKEYIQSNPELANYTRSLWQALRDWLSNDLESSSSQLQQQIERMGLWLGQKLAEDQELRTSINEHMQALASGAAPQFADFLTGHISDTVRKWDAQDMSRQIELSIGPDLQYIRISGTAVGCVIGILLFLVSHVGEITLFLK
ncbi:uncharacterized membrane-anchored protein YjiN (DUF445 family) [Acidovorax temperans]|mgnify:FL=1|jgi:uncharacterized membrane-anchored protein YjiN (DUF445 family)|uniref:Uncharacterized membrane-anchored protein YjiN (DUF445 family) n=1 Tax=Acidovorax temperans TaxID=80878 RepID=A0A543KVW4_9BURK|nr:DUF445 domain-containing protein [Acidovorax temperans]MBP9942013.1 DUF445 family protein [Comamonas sp.]TQM99207.1 uncharacterized membrane-anchored protein YjiN (DUF445 family) [Acidovorax temperans]